MTTASETQAGQAGSGSGLIGQIEVHSIDWIPDAERHGRPWLQSMLWFLGNFQYFTIPIGFVGPALGLSLGWSILAGVAGIAFGTLFMPPRDPSSGCRRSSSPGPSSATAAWSSPSSPRSSPTWRSTWPTRS